MTCEGNVSGNLRPTYISLAGKQQLRINGHSAPGLREGSMAQSAAYIRHSLIHRLRFPYQSLHTPDFHLPSHLSSLLFGQAFLALCSMSWGEDSALQSCEQLHWPTGQALLLMGLACAGATHTGMLLCSRMPERQPHEVHSMIYKSWSLNSLKAGQADSSALVSTDT